MLHFKLTQNFSLEFITLWYLFHHSIFIYFFLCMHMAGTLPLLFTTLSFSLSTSPAKSLSVWLLVIQSSIKSSRRHLGKVISSQYTTGLFHKSVHTTHYINLLARVLSSLLDNQEKCFFSGLNKKITE